MSRLNAIADDPEVLTEMESEITVALGVEYRQRLFEMKSRGRNKLACEPDWLRH